MNKFRIRLKRNPESNCYDLKLFNEFTYAFETFMNNIRVSTLDDPAEAVFLNFYNKVFDSEYIKKNIFNKLYNADYAFDKNNIINNIDLVANIIEINEDDIFNDYNLIRFNVTNWLKDPLYAYIPVDYFDILTGNDDPYYIPETFDFSGYSMDIKKEMYKTMTCDDISKVVLNTFKLIISPQSWITYLNGAPKSLLNAVASWAPSKSNIHLFESYYSDNDKTYHIVVYTSRPGLLIGKSGIHIDVLNHFISDYTKTMLGAEYNVKIDIKEFNPYDLDRTNLKIGYEMF